MEWLEKIRPPKPYRYIFYRLNIISKKLGNNPPEFSTMLLIAITTLFQFFFILLGIGALLGEDVWGLFFSGSNFVSKIIFLGIFLYSNYLIFIYKGKWKFFYEEFKNESNKEKKKGTIYLFIYMAISILCIVGAGYIVHITSPYT